MVRYYLYFMNLPFLAITGKISIVVSLLFVLLVFPKALLEGKESGASSGKYPSPSTDISQIKLANLSSDINMLQAKVARLEMLVEQLNRENAELRVELGEKADKDNQYVTKSELSGALNELSQDLINNDTKQKNSIISEVSQLMERLAIQTESALKALAESIEAQPVVDPTIQFSDDYSKEGVAYTVQSGDTLSEIARRFNSTVSDIQNANRITDPSKLQVGRTIFVPKSE